MRSTTRENASRATEADRLMREGTETIGQAMNYLLAAKLGQSNELEPPLGLTVSAGFLARLETHFCLCVFFAIRAAQKHLSAAECHWSIRQKAGKVFTHAFLQRPR